MLNEMIYYYLIYNDIIWLNIKWGDIVGKAIGMTKKERIRSKRKQSVESHDISVLDFLKQNRELVRFELEVYEDGLGIRVGFENSPLIKLYSAKELSDAIDEDLLRSLSDNLMEVLMQGIVNNVNDEIE